MKITDAIEQKIIRDNITRTAKRLDELQPSFMADDEEVDLLNAELEYWLMIERRLKDERG